MKKPADLPKGGQINPENQILIYSLHKYKILRNAAQGLTVVYRRLPLSAAMRQTWSSMIMKNLNQYPFANAGLNGLECFQFALNTLPYAANVAKAKDHYQLPFFLE